MDRPRGPITIGIILIVIGTVFLLANTVLPGLNFNTLWPLIIIAWGSSVAITGLIPPPNIERVLRGVLLTVVGVIFMYNTLGILPYSYWLDLIAFWPVLLIALGIAILADITRSKIVAYLPPLVIIAAVIAAFFYHDVIFKPNTVESFAYSKDVVGKIENGKVNIDFAAGLLDIGASDSLYLINGSDIYSKHGPMVTYVRSGKDIAINIRQPKKVVTIMLNRQERWNIDLNKKVIWNIAAKTGVSESKLDFSALHVASFAINAGVGDIEIKLGKNEARTNGSIKTGISSAKLFVPMNAGLRIQMNKGLASTRFVNIHTSQSSNGNRVIYTTSGFDKARHQIDLDVDVGISSFTVEGY